MITRKSTFFLGLFILIIPFLGFPTSWKTTLIVLSAIVLMGLSVKVSLPVKNAKPKIIKKEKILPEFHNNDLPPLVEPKSYPNLVAEQKNEVPIEVIKPKLDSVSRPRRKPKGGEGNIAE